MPKKIIKDEEVVVTTIEEQEVKETKKPKAKAVAKEATSTVEVVTPTEEVVTPKKEYTPKEEKFYNRFLDKLPRKIILDNKWELIDNSHKISAHKMILENKKYLIHIANLQNIMMYLLINYIMLMKINNVKRSYSFYSGYLICRDLISWASDKYYDASTKNSEKFLLKQFFPSEEVYGNKNLSDFYIVVKHKFDLKNGTISNNEKYKFSQPKHVYDRDLQYNKIPKKYLEFDINNSEVFDLDGEQIVNFLDKKN